MDRAEETRATRLFVTAGGKHKRAGDAARRELLADVPRTMAAARELLQHPARLYAEKALQYGAPVAGCAIVFAGLLAAVRDQPWAAVPLLLSGGATYITFIVQSIRASMEPLKINRGMARVLAKVEDPAADVLFLVLRMVRGQQQSNQSESFLTSGEFRAAAVRLCRLLLALPPAEARTAIEPHRQWFYSPLTSRYSVGTNVSLVKTQLALIRHTADVETRDSVAWLARWEAATPHEKKARAAAQKTLAELDAVIEKQKPGKVLLRPVDSLREDTLLRPASGTGIDALLRPASGAATPEAHLLRPDESR